MANSSFIDEAIEQIDVPFSSNAPPNETNSCVTIVRGNQQNQDSPSVYQLAELVSATCDSSPEDDDRTVHPSDIDYEVERVHAMKINKKTGKKQYLIKWKEHIKKT